MHEGHCVGQSVERVVAFIRLIGLMIPLTTLPARSGCSGSPDVPSGVGRSAAGRRGWLSLKVLVFLLTFLAAWLLNSQVASSAGPVQAIEIPASSGRAKSLAGGPLYRDLAFAVAARWLSRPEAPQTETAADGEWIRSRIYDLAIAASALSRTSDDPRRRMEAIAAEVFQRQGFQILGPFEDGYAADQILLGPVLARRGGSPIGLAMLYLAVAEILTPPLSLQLVTLPMGAAVRHQDGDQAVSVVFDPREPVQILRDSQVRSLLGARVDAQEGHLQPLTRAQCHGVLLSELSRAAKARREMAAAFALLREAVELSPGRFALLVEFAGIAREMDDAAAAKAALDRAIDLRPEYPGTLLSRGILLRSLGERAAALKDLQRAAEIDPKGASEALLEIASLEKDLGHPQLSLDAYRKYLGLEADAGSRAKVKVFVRELEQLPDLEILQHEGEGGARFEALQRVAAAPTHKAVEILIRGLRDPNLRFARLTWKSLRQVTRQQIEFDPDAWERWWAASDSGMALHSPTRS